MQLTRLGHAAVRLTDPEGVLVIDPGSFSGPDVLEGADVVLVTHVHGDHVDVDRLTAALGADPHLVVHGPAPVADALVAAGAPRDRVRTVVPGQVLTVLDHEVQVLGGLHEVIHPDMPRAVNVSYLVDRAVLHPGDAFVDPGEGTAVDVLLAPVSGPWLRLRELVDWVRAVRPRVVVPTHDALLSPAGRALVLDRLGPEGLGAGYGYTIDDSGDLHVTAGVDVRAAVQSGEILAAHPEFDQVPALEADEDRAPRPEEDAADAAR